MFCQFHISLFGLIHSHQTQKKKIAATFVWMCAQTLDQQTSERARSSKTSKKKPHPSHECGTEMSRKMMEKYILIFRFGYFSTVIELRAGTRLLQSHKPRHYV